MEEDTAYTFTQTVHADQPATDARESRRLTGVLKAAGVILATALAVIGVRHAWEATRADPPALAPPPSHMAAPVPAAAATTVVASPAAPAPTPLALATALVLAGQSVPMTGDHVALPTGARFELQVTTPRAGRIEVLAVAPSGGAPALLWVGEAGIGRSTLQTPMLRLEGERGVERLRVMLRGAGGELLGMREIRIWHL